jgi:hypothetical protein
LNPININLIRENAYNKIQCTTKHQIITSHSMGEKRMPADGLNPPVMILQIPKKGNDSLDS